MISNFPKIIKRYLADLPHNDYPVLDTSTFVYCWLSFSLDQSLKTMRGLFRRLNMRGIQIDISSFSKASKKRDVEVFKRLFETLKAAVKSQHSLSHELALFPIDSSVITLTSKLMWKQGFHQVKLFAGTTEDRHLIDGVQVRFGQCHDSKYGDETLASTPENGVAVMDRGFSSSERVKALLGQKERYFVLRIKNNAALEALEDGSYQVWSDRRAVKLRVVAFCDLEKATEFRLVTNLPSEGEHGFSNAEIGEIYRQRWQIELVWKFLKMHLKLARLITKNPNGIEIQIYSCLTAYLLLQLVEIPQEFGSKLLDKLSYLQAFMSEEISYVHWFRKLLLRC